MAQHTIFPINLGDLGKYFYNPSFDGKQDM